MRTPPLSPVVPTESRRRTIAASVAGTVAALGLGLTLAACGSSTETAHVTTAAAVTPVAGHPTATVQPTAAAQHNAAAQAATATNLTATDSGTAAATGGPRSTSTQKTVAPGPAAVNLPATNAVKVDLRGGFAAASPGLSEADVAGTVPGTVFYGLDLTADTYWAVADFQPTIEYLDRTASLPAEAPALAAFPGGPVVLSRPAGSNTWTIQSTVGLGRGACGPVPVAVLRAWSMTPGHCRFNLAWS